MVITQSGETADTIAAQREALTRGVKTIAVSNVAEATIVREAGAALITGAGPELAVPATKSFTTQVTILYLMALFLARKRGRMNSEVTRSYLQRLLRLPDAIEEKLSASDTLEVMKAVKARRGPLVTVATEGAAEVASIADDVFFVPAAPELLLPIVEVIPLQLFAYHVAVRKGYDVDHPRNLVKAVVTE